MRNDYSKPGEINVDSLYTLEEVRDRLRLGQKSMRAAQRQGLKVGRIGRRGYVLGRDFIDWYTRQIAPSTLPVAADGVAPPG